MEALEVTEKLAVALDGAVQCLTSLGYKNPLRWLRSIKPDHDEFTPRDESFSYCFRFWIRGNPHRAYILEVKLFRDGSTGWVVPTAEGVRPLDLEERKMFFYFKGGNLDRHEGFTPDSLFYS